MNELDEIMSGADLAPEAAPIQQEQTPAPASSQPRDDSGRFAPKPGDVPVAENAPAATDPAAGQELVEEHQATGGIPQARLKAEAEKRREAEADAAALRREIAELRGMVTAQRQPAPQPQQEQQQPASIFEDPDAYLQSQISPVQAQLQETREMLMELQATQRHGAEAVEAAKEAAKALFGTPEGRALGQKPGNLFDNMVTWHKQQQAFAKVGSDPDAWFQAEYEKRINDPAEQAKLIERFRAGVAGNPANRSQQPIVNLPPSLNRLPAGGNQPADNDMSDGAIFSHATAR